MTVVISDPYPATIEVSLGGRMESSKAPALMSDSTSSVFCADRTFQKLETAFLQIIL